MRALFKTFVSFLFPSQCHCCERFLEEGQQGICPDCLLRIRWIEPPFCTICGVPFLSGEIKNHPCGTCVTQKKYYTIARAIGHYDGPLREAIHRWKYEEKNYLTTFFGEKMAEGFHHYWDPTFFDLLIPVPLYPQRLRERGFNQALLLVKELSQRTGIPYQSGLLQKERATIPQIDLNGTEREKGVKGSFHVERKEDVEGKKILLVDDVYTTGATVNECSKVLLKAETDRVDVLTLAHAIKNF